MAQAEIADGVLLLVLREKSAEVRELISCAALLECA